MNRIKQVMRKPLSETDIKTILGSDTKILTYPQLATYNTLEELLPRPYDFVVILLLDCLLYTSPSPRDLSTSRMPSSA